MKGQVKKIIEVICFSYWFISGSGLKKIENSLFYSFSFYKR